jgi:prevent-host-death family protein
MTDFTVASTEFQSRAGLYIEKAAKNPVFITKHSRPVRVLIDIDEYERLKARDTRQAYYAHELPEEVIKALEEASYDHLDPSLDHLSDDEHP